MNQSTVKVRTPEHIELEYELAGIGSRGLAQLVDILILAGLYIVIVVALILWLLLHILGVATSYIIGGAILLSFLAFWGYFILFEYYMSGQTPGKRLLHIRVVQRDGRQPGFFAVLLRNIFRLIDILPQGYLVGVIVMIADRTERRIGDLVAGTIVVSTTDASSAAIHTLADLDRLQPLASEPSGTNGSADRPLDKNVPADNVSDSTANEEQEQVKTVITVESLHIGLELLQPLPASWEDFFRAFYKRTRSMTVAKRMELSALAWERLINEKRVIAVDKIGTHLETRSLELQGNLELQQKMDLIAALAEHISGQQTTKRKRRSNGMQQRRKRQ